MCEAEGFGPNKKFAKVMAANELIEVLRGGDKDNGPEEMPDLLNEM